MNRRTFLRHAATAASLPYLMPLVGKIKGSRSRARPGRPGWPSDSQWGDLDRQVGGRLIKVKSPLADLRGSSDKRAIDRVFQDIKNPYFIADQPGMTQTSGWVGAWISEPSAYAIAATSAEDIQAGVEFARKHDLRLVVKGAGHSYLGGSSAPDSLLIWTHAMDDVHLHDAFVPKGADGRVAPQHAVSVGAGARWWRVYNEVTTKGGRYVQGGGCGTVGVAGLVQGGGFGSFSKRFGLSAAGLLEAEVVTADGKLRVVNDHSHPDLFWALKGGGGGSFGVITRLTLKTHELPENFGAVFFTVQAPSDDAFRQLIERFLTFYRDSLMNPNWGEAVEFRGNNRLDVHMVFQGLDQRQAQHTWAPFLAEVKEVNRIQGDPTIVALPARHFWDRDFWAKAIPNIVYTDPRPGAPQDHVLWEGDREQSGMFLHAYESAWLPAGLLQAERLEKLAQLLFEATRSWGVALHFNKGLAGAPPDAISSARETAMNPAVLDAFALAIVATGEGPAYPEIAGHEPDRKAASEHRLHVSKSMELLRTVVPRPASYVNETSYFEPQWQRAFWGAHYPRLLKVKRKYDPEGLFFVHHGVGSEGWSPDGFERGR